MLGLDPDQTTSGTRYMKTQQERQAEKRREELDLIEQQVKEGNLVIRKMTAAERKRFRPRSRAKTA
jgi:hypothetical protein